MINLPNLIGQNEFVEKVTPYVNMYQCHLAPEGRPAGIFYLLGPTGVGKTFAVQCITEKLQNNAKNMILINCAEYQMDHEIAKLIGAPPGYLGHRETAPVITQQKLVTNNPDAPSIVLFDEIEKASPNLHKLILGIMDNGILRLGDGTQVSFEKTFVFMTSNVGSSVIAETFEKPFGFNREVRLDTKTQQKVQKELRKAFSAEFLNRVDEFIQFNSLSENSLVPIVIQHLDKIVARLNEPQPATTITALSKSMPVAKLRYTDDVPLFLAEKAFNPQYGAREVKRTVFREVQSEVANILTSYPKGTIDTIELSINNSRLAIRVTKVNSQTETVTTTSSKTNTVGNTPILTKKEDPAIMTTRKKKQSSKRTPF